MRCCRLACPGNAQWMFFLRAPKNIYNYINYCFTASVSVVFSISHLLFYSSCEQKLNNFYMLICGLTVGRKLTLSAIIFSNSFAVSSLVFRIRFIPLAVWYTLVPIWIFDNLLCSFWLFSINWFGIWSFVSILTIYCCHHKC